MQINGNCAFSKHTIYFMAVWLTPVGCRKIIWYKNLTFILLLIKDIESWNLVYRVKKSHGFEKKNAIT